jgi:hypothetical protein
MPMNRTACARRLSALGEPDIRVAGLSLWTRAREFPNATDRWDGNWLQIVAYCSYPGAKVIVDGPFLRTDEIRKFGAQCATLHSTLVGQAHLDCMEPYLSVVLTGNSRGHVAVEIELTPNHLNQRHEFRDQMDQSYLPAIVADCTRVLERFPVVDAGE